MQLSGESVSVGLNLRDAQEVVQQCLRLLQDVGFSSAPARDFAITSLLPSIISIAGGVPDVCTTISTGILDTVEILSASSDPGAVPRANACVCV